ncbi:hypothetical protein BWI97_26840, partial [Siphonobacter sp. BAB-5405]
MLTTVEGIQVVRTFYLKKYGKIGHPIELSIKEVMQHWITPEGKHCMLAVATQTMSWYFDLWLNTEKLELRDIRNHN